MKIQVVATISANGYLLKRENNAKKQINSGKYGFSALQKRADLMLHKESSLIALLEEKRQSSDTNYLVESTPETLDLIKGLFLYRLADELMKLSGRELNLHYKQYMGSLPWRGMQGNIVDSIYEVRDPGWQENSIRPQNK